MGDRLVERDKHHTRHRARETENKPLQPAVFGVIGNLTSCRSQPWIHQLLVYTMAISVHRHPAHPVSVLNMSRDGTLTP